ncbi:MAG: nickel pincer cofactor biosynthesis protein LarC2 [Anaerolineae bacterium]
MPEQPATPTKVLLLECNLDDMTGEALGYALERLLEFGALDAWYTPIYAKKNRPAVVLSVLARLEDGDQVTRAILTETTTLGVRTRVVDRVVCERETVLAETRWGAVPCKVKRLDGQLLSVKPEYEDCARIAREHTLSLEAVVNEARRAARDKTKQGDIT